ncbi:MAG TPA: DUF4388 domain-containing protein [Thermoanaerobaculaceae bacterium]|nr:DUF4388 domain-containing protein [Thermoanaerobaculaceae bacterium]
MSLSGHLTELALPDLLQIVALAQKTGRLDLTTRDGEGLIVFRHGRIIYAASNAARETLGSILVCRHLVSEDALRQALERQYRSREERRLGSILVQMGAISGQTLESVIYDQIERVIGTLVKWRDGYFKFEPMEISDHGEVGVDAREFLAESGFNAHQIALELSRIADEARRDAEAASGGGRAAAREGAAPTAAGEPGAPAPVKSTLGRILSARPTPTLTAETTLEVLRAGAGLFSRVVLLLVERHGLTGVGQIGVRTGDAEVDENIRNLWIPLQAKSLPTQAVAVGRSCVGPLERTAANELLVSELGGAWPSRAAAIPLKAGRDVVAVLYGDTMPAAGPLPAVDHLEAKFAAIGEAITGAEPGHEKLQRR